MSEIKITPEDLKKSAHTYRKMLLTLPHITLQSMLPHITLRSGVQYKQTVGQIMNGAQIGPYDPKRKGDGAEIKGRTLETFLGSVIDEFDPNQVLQSIYGSLVVHGEGLKTTDISKAVISSMMMSLSENLFFAVFNAKRNDTGTKSVDLFNGFDTIAETEITAGEISVANNNLFEFGTKIDSSNAKDALKEYYRSADPRLKAVHTKMHVPFEILEAYEDDYQMSAGAVPYNTSFEKVFLEGSNGKCEIVPLSNKEGSKIIQLTTKDNMIMGTGSGNILETLDVDRFSAFLVTLSVAMIMGVQYESIHARRIHFGKLTV